ncbi:Polysaccharide lyase family 4, domain III [Paenibacillus sp. yr247]|uniref:glycoside hydrolase family 38 N-terminal domain-containing protein n=1 Tax=Paenibacillus sp. yr247 TaxID=1761880 RepID=UPI000887D29F|nr:glycosyl hydrolase-related protein [Paenibacillus sp. yr247]SDO39340.1 Polysaccharide lyase family 4, domain III [Paenibacillus sp. yr247]
MEEKVIWSIGSTESGAEDLFDNYKVPNRLGDIIWDADAKCSTTKGTKWPMFHPSEADPDGGYRLHPYTIQFNLEEQLAQNYVLTIDYLVIAPRASYLEISVNGVSGYAYVRPTPSQSGEIALQSGLHTTIYSDGKAEIIVPGHLLARGKNKIELICHDGGEILVIDRIEAIKRLDRMANGAGLLYQKLAFSPVSCRKDSVLNRVEVQSSVLYRRSASGELINVCHLYVELAASLTKGELTLHISGSNRSEEHSIELSAVALGHVHFTFECFDGEGPVTYVLQGSLDGKEVRCEGEFYRRRKWKVYITPHAHTDIGYTHRQWEVAERLCRNVDTALDIIEKEADPAEPAFTYHLDAGWVLETYLATRDDRRNKQLIQALQAGKISLAGNYADLLTQFAGLEDLIRNHEFVNDLLQPAGMRPKINAVVDVASLTSSLPAIMEGSGIKYLIHANNQDRGPFRLNGGLHKLSPFYWEGPQGGRVLCWLAKMYCELRKVCGSPPMVSSAERGLDMWLQEFEREDYAPDAVLLYGQEADNTDMDPQPVDFVKQWNRDYTYPKLIACDVSEFFEYVENEYASKLHTVKGDGGAYWEDGAGSSITPTIQTRKAQAMLPAAERLEALAVIHSEGWAYPLKQYDEAWREVLLYDEHTWGAFLSATEPEALLQKDQWAVKQHMADSAYQWANRLLHTSATRHSLNWNNNGREVVVYNPHSWSFSGKVQVEIAPQEIVLHPVTLEEIPMRPIKVLPSQAVVELWVEDLPGLSYRRFLLQNKEAASLTEKMANHEMSENAPCTYTMENDGYRITIDLNRGCISSWLDKALDQELADASSPWGFGQLLYAEGGEGTRLMSNQADLPDGDPQVLTEFMLIEMKSESFSYGQSVKLRGIVPYGELEIEWTLYHLTKQVEVSYSYKKEERLNKEAVYIAFPCSLPDAQVLSDSQLGWMDWDKDQLPGGCKEWLPLQTGIIVQKEHAAVHIASPDIPLFCVGNIVQGKWPKEMKLSGGTVFSYVLNNYWHTNYKGSQGGTIRFRYFLSSGKKQTLDQAYRIGWQSRQAMYAQRMSFQDFREMSEPYANVSGGTLAKLDTVQAVITTWKQARRANGFIVRLQEIAGLEQRPSLSIPGKRITAAWLTDLLENERSELPLASDGSIRIPIQSWGLATVRIEVE